MAGKWTKAQQQAIQSARVRCWSALRRSGKTSVLVERAIGLICDENHPIDADRLLIVTYTNAAAAGDETAHRARLAQLARKPRQSAADQSAGCPVEPASAPSTPFVWG